MGKWPEKESDLAPPLISYLEDLRWEVYQEVQCSYAGDIADLVALQGRLLWVIELKRSLSFEVIAQANGWRGYAHYISVAVPVSSRSRHSKGRYLAEQIMKERGIGFFTIQGPQSWQPEPVARVKEHPKLNRHAQSDKLREALCEEQKTYAQAGNADGKRWTPFQATCREVVNTVKMTPGLCMKELVDAISHHYSTDKSARAHIADWIRAGVIEGVELRPEGKYLRVYPVDARPE